MDIEDGRIHRQDSDKFVEASPLVRDEEPRLEIGPQLKERLALVPETEQQKFDDKQTFWLQSLMEREAVLPRSFGYEGLVDAYIKPQSPIGAERVEQAINALTPNIDNTIESYRNFFGAVSGHAARESEPIDPDKNKAEEKLYNVFGVLFEFNGSLSDSGSLSEEVRYDPMRFLAGLESLSWHLKPLVDKSVVLRELLEELEEIKRSEFHRAYFDLVNDFTPEASNDDQSRSFNNSIYEHRDFYKRYWTDSEHSRIESAQSLGRSYTLDDLFRAGYIAVRESPRTSGSLATFNKKSCKLASEYRESVKKLKSVLDRFEYLCLQAKLGVNSDYQTCDPELTPGGTDITIRKLESPSVLMKHKKTGESVVPNNFHLGSEEECVVLIGGNGCGKTGLLAGVVNTVLQAHRGAKSFAERVDTPVLRGLVYGVNLSKHTGSGSSFQNEMDALVESLQELEQTREEGEPAVLILDEPFRGTDFNDSIKLIAALMKYCQAHNIKLAFSTHVVEVGERLESLKSMGIKAAAYTLTEDHEVVPGGGKSRGVERAEALGLHSAITKMARIARSDGESLSLPDTSTYTENEVSNTGSTTYTQHVVVEGELSRTVRNGLQTYESVGESTRVFAKYSPFGNYADVSEGGWKYSDLRMTFSDDFMGKLRSEDFEISETLLSSLFDYEDRSALNEQLSPLVDFPNECARPKTIPRHFREPFSRSDSDFDDSLSDYQAFCRQYGGQYGDVYPVFKLARLAEVVSSLGLAQIDPSLESLCNFTQSDMFFDFVAFHNESNVPKTIDFPPTAEEWEIWCEWVDLLQKYESEIKQLKEQLGLLNFYSTIAGTVAQEQWAAVDNEAEAGHVEISGLLNLALAGELGKEAVVLNDVLLDLESQIQAITGTNGGGKTQFLQSLAVALFLGKRLGYLPAEFAKIGQLDFIDLHINAGEHSDQYSSFEDEVLRIDNVIKEYEARGCPANGVILLDEPFKGTSEEDGAVLLAALTKYFSDKGVKLVFTTHYSSFFKILDKLDDESKIPCCPLYVDYFSKDKFKVKRGRTGRSEGIRVAFERGLPEEFRQYIEEYESLVQAA